MARSETVTFRVLPGPAFRRSRSWLAVGAPAEERGGSHAPSINNDSGPASARTRARAGDGRRRIRECRPSCRRVGRQPARLRPERHHLRPEHAGQRDSGNRRRDLCPTGRRRDGHEPLRVPVQAGRVRNSRRASANEGRLLHRGRRPRCLPDGRDDQRQDRGLQPLPRDRGHEQLRRPGQFLAHAVQPDPEHQQPQPGRLSRLGKLLGGLAGRVDAPSQHRRRQPLAHGLLHGRAAVRQRRLHRRLEPPVRHQRLPATVAHPQQPDRRLVERRVEPGLRRRRGRAVGGEFPEPALHDPRHDARQP